MYTRTPKFYKWTRGFKPSNTSKQHLELINRIAEENNIPKVPYIQILTHQNNDLDRLKSVENEMDYARLVKDY